MQTLSMGSEAGLLEALGNQPITVGVAGIPFKQYTGGIFTDCLHVNVNHGVLGIYNCFFDILF